MDCVKGLMELRTILLFTSIIMIGFSISLYFQKEQTVRTVNYDEYKNLQYKEERSHSLEDFNKKITPYKFENIIQDFYQKNQIAGVKTRILEIGMGNGRVLMELKKLFPKIEFYGINREKTHTFFRRESFISTALKFEIFKEDDLKTIELPYVIFQDLDFGTEIPYDDNKFDIIFSQSTIGNIKYKFELFNSISRVLKPNGISIHTDFEKVNVYSNGVILEQSDVFAEIRKKGIEIISLDISSSIRFKKSQRIKKFPTIPHQTIPENLNNLSSELRKPEMGYNLIN